MLREGKSRKIVDIRRMEERTLEERTSKDEDILVSEKVISYNGGRHLHDRWIVDSNITWHMTPN